MPKYCNEPYSDLGTYTNKVFSAWTEVCSGSYRTRASIIAPGVSIWAIFEFLDWVGDINNSISFPNYCDGPHSDLDTCVNKVFSAWTEVWSGT